MKKLLPIIIIFMTVAALGGWLIFSKTETSKVTNFEECIAAGNPAMESYPRQCRHEDQTFTEELTAKLSEKEALDVAQKSRECSNTGILTDDVSYNSFTKTWWMGLERMPELEKDGCNPACVVNEETRTAEVNWRCTGLIEE